MSGNIVQRIVNAWNGCCGTCAGGVLAAHVREAKAQAWDEGFEAGEQDVMEHESRGWPDDDPCIPNPYREETK